MQCRRIGRLMRDEGRLRMYTGSPHTLFWVLRCDKMLVFCTDNNLMYIEHTIRLHA